MPNIKDSAGIAQLVERNVANVKVAGSNPVSRSIFHFYQEGTTQSADVFAYSAPSAGSILD